MSKIAPMRLENGFLYVEMDEVEVPPLTETGQEPSKPVLEDTPEDAELIGFKEDLEQAVATLRSTIGGLAADVTKALRESGPHEWTLELNIGFKGKAKPIPVLLSGEANGALKLTATWKRE